TPSTCCRRSGRRSSCTGSSGSWRTSTGAISPSVRRPSRRRAGTRRRRDPAPARLPCRGAFAKRHEILAPGSGCSFVSITVVVFYLLAAITVGSALGVALSNSIVYSAFALMGTLLGVAALFVLLGADFLGVVQLLVYVGGILVLTLFAVMLTHRIADVHVSNRAVGRPLGVMLVGGVCVYLVRVALRAHWVVRAPVAPGPTIYGVGDAFLTEYVLPFEVASVVLLAALIAAVVVSRKEVRG